METFLKEKKVKIALLSLIAIIGLFTFVKTINEIKTNRFIGRETSFSKTISVTGEGEVTAIPNIAKINIHLTKEAENTKDAQKLLNDSIQKTLDYLKAQKIEDKDIKSEFGGLNPKYSYEKVACFMYPCPQRDPKVVGYVASQDIEIKIREVDNSSAIRTGLSELGITGISGPFFSVEDEKIFEAKARTEAIKEARKNAKVLAKDLGVKLGKVVSFYETNDEAMGRGMYSLKSSAVMEDRETAPVLPKGENKITSSVTVTYEIK